jgi:hypothetical protein
VLLRNDEFVLNAFYMTVPIELRIAGMERRHGGLTEAIAAYYHEAATVCLSRHHSAPHALEIRDGEQIIAATVDWMVPDSRTLGAWANSIDATEAGAYCCALAAVEITRGWYAVHRAEQGTGADYYVGPVGAGAEDLEDCFRLEVSGTDQGAETELSARLAVKIAQTLHGNSSLPALAGVVGFEHSIILIANVNPS